MAINWGEASPGDSDVVSQYPANERAVRASIKNGYNQEHDDVEGRHQIPAGSIATRDSITTWVDGSWYVNYDDNRFQLQRAQKASGGPGVPDSWVVISNEFLAGTVLVFRQAAAPLGWVQQVDANDRVLRTVSGAGGGFGGGWAISGLSNESANHTHNYSGNSGTESADHTHTYSGSTTAKAGGTSQGTSPTGGPSTPLDNHFHNFSGTSSGISNTHYHGVSGVTAGVSVGHSHSGDGAWRPAYIDIITAVKS